MTFRRLLFVAVLVGAAIPAGAHGFDPAWEVSDPRHDMAIYRGAILMPVSSVDLTHAAWVPGDGGIVAAHVNVGDLSRRGMEDALFVRSEHAVRAWIMGALLDDGSALVAAAVSVAPAFPEGDGGAILLHAYPGGPVHILPATPTYDAARNEVRIDFAPVARTPTFTFAVGSLHGCATVETCDPALPLRSGDGAPDGGSNYYGSYIPPVWWEGIFG